jgi:hypothetical protein
MKIARLTVLVLLVALVGVPLAACAGDVPKQLSDAEKLWKSQKLADYDFTLERQCFCPEEYRGPVNIQVRNRAAVSVTFVSDGSAITDDRFADADTVDKLFTILKNAYTGKNSFNQKAASVTVTYDPALGFPASFFIDVSEQIADEEQGYTVTDFAPR